MEIFIFNYLILQLTYRYLPLDCCNFKYGAYNFVLLLHCLTSLYARKFPFKGYRAVKMQDKALKLRRGCLMVNFKILTK